MQEKLNVLGRVTVQKIILKLLLFCWASILRNIIIAKMNKYL